MATVTPLSPAQVLVLIFKACLIVVVLLLGRGLYWLLHLVVLAPPFDPLRHLPGPEGKAFQNHFREVMDPNKSVNSHEQWTKSFGKTFRFHGFGKHDYRLMSLDARALSHILNSPIYEKPWQTRRFLGRLLGRGIFAMEGDEHRSLRKFIAPAFSTRSIRGLTPIFLQKAEELRDRWDLLLPVVSPSRPLSPYEPKDVHDGQSAVIDVLNWLSRATFDIIGIAGFDYQFNSLEDETEEVYLAYRKMFDAADRAPGFKGLAQIFFPIIEKIFPDETSRITTASLKTVTAAGKTLIENKKALILAEKASGQAPKEKSIISLLINANVSEDPSQRLSDEHLLDQLSTFLFAGSDSTAVGMAWCIHHLSLNPDVQSRLRKEILRLHEISSEAVSEDRHDFADSVDALPYLDAVVREALRLSPPAHGAIRVATQNDVIPLSEPIVMKDGSVATEVNIRKGSFVHIPIEGVNLSSSIWGEDSLKFNPDRWIEGQTPTHPGLANLMTFSFGPHSCPGWKFAIFETKLILAVLLPHFVFSPAEEIKKYNAILTRPYVYNKYELGPQLPVRVGRYQAESK
ncbi:hypothetical protein JAAARDRAFT_60368 [Jaapia argillacea MUCL 33604]|uniref:Cytochrome P450 n=1 Tax=Jaapia argillacea MUCL 33604 TaxID=933084 RepID=A0A067PJB9_9AGAM|nr:hypothetical protein JAAARDRAFT_60368 [Jaapia argillacea MUCL 33604]